MLVLGVLVVALTGVGIAGLLLENRIAIATVRVHRLGVGDANVRKGTRPSHTRSAGESAGWASSRTLTAAWLSPHDPFRMALNAPLRPFRAFQARPLPFRCIPLYPAVSHLFARSHPVWRAGGAAVHR